MKKLFFYFILFTSVQLTAQKTTRVYVDFGFRYDVQANYKTTWNSLPPEKTTLAGSSKTVGLNLSKTLNNKFSLSVGAGIYDLSIQRIRTKAGIGNVLRKSRLIDYIHPDGIKVAFSTNDYHYYNLRGNIGAAYTFKKLKNSTLSTGVDLLFFQTFAQQYSISYDAINYKTNRNRFLGYGINTFIGTTKNLGKNNKYFINPKLTIPVFQSLKKDAVFWEHESSNMRKLFSGVGMSVAFGKVF